MAALRFQIHVDAENPGTIGTNPKLRNGSTSSGIRGKVFQESGTPGIVKPRKALGDVNTPASARPRKALGDVNGIKEPVLKGKSGGLKPQSLNSQIFRKPEAKKPQEKSLKKQEPRVSVAQPLPGLHTLPECEEIEHMYNERDPDEDENIWPAKERLSTYIDKLISWRPPCLLGPGTASDDDEEVEKRISDIIGQLDSLPVPSAPIVEEPLAPVESLIDPMPYFDLPFADISLDCTDDVSPSLSNLSPTNIHDITPQGLEDSYSVETHLGTLALREDL